MQRIKCDLIKKCCEKGNFTRVSYQKKLFYYETPKCASSSMKKMLHDALPDYQHGDVSKLNDSFTTFTVVRNPFDRFVSNYHMITTTPHRITNILQPMFGKRTLTGPVVQTRSDYGSPGFGRGSQKQTCIPHRLHDHQTSRPARSKASRGLESLRERPHNCEPFGSVPRCFEFAQ